MRSSTTCQLDRQPARTQRDGELVGGLDGEAAAADARRPPRIGSRMFGAEMTTLSRMIANGRPTFSWVTRAKRRLPVWSNDRTTLACRRRQVVVLAGVGNHVAGDDRPGAGRRSGRAFLGSAGSGCRSAPGPVRAARRRSRSTILNSSRAVRPISCLSASGVLHGPAPGRGWLVAVADDGRLERAERVDAPVDDLAGGVHRLVDGGVEPGRGRTQR